MQTYLQVYEYSYKCARVFTGVKAFLQERMYIHTVGYRFTFLARIEFGVVLLLIIEIEAIIVIALQFKRLEYCMR